MKTKIFTALTALTLCFTICIPKVAAKSPCNWYCVHTTDHQRPKVDAALSYIDKYDGYYIAPESQGKVIYLTFDAGYENGNVAKVLDVLKDKEVPAAFFILAHLIEKDTALVERMFEEGHTVCNHTAKHKDLSSADQATFECELETLAALCREKTGREMAKFYRPPEGRFSEENLKWAQAMGYRTIFWSFAYADWDNRRQMTPDKAKQKILSNIHPGEVMLLHPTSETNAQVLGEVIDECRLMGYRFGTLDELTAHA